MLGPSNASALDNTPCLPPRLFEADLTMKNYKLPFNGKEYDARLQITAYGEVLFRASDCAMALIDAEDQQAATKYYGGVAKKVAALHHQDRNLLENIQVISSPISARLCLILLDYARL